VGKIQRAYKIFERETNAGKKPEEAYKIIAEELNISVRSARAYVWRVKNPDKYKAMLERYFAKKKAKAEVKAEEKESTPEA
jgi:hypothetical protein